MLRSSRYVLGRNLASTVWSACAPPLSSTCHFWVTLIIIVVLRSVQIVRVNDLATRVLDTRGDGWLFSTEKLLREDDLFLRANHRIAKTSILW